MNTMTYPIRGQNGHIYTFFLQPFELVKPRFPGVYFVARSYPQIGASPLELLYIGQTEDFHERHKAHHRAADFYIHRAQWFGWLAVSNERDRREIEADLVWLHRPILNNLSPLGRSPTAA